VFSTESTFTMEAWIYAESGADYFVSQWNTNEGAFIRFYTDNKILAYIDGSGSPAGIDASLQTWYYAVLTSDGTTGRLYVNAGVPETLGNGVTWPSEGFYISDRSAGDRRFPGIIDEVRCSNIARNSSWINTSYNTTNNQSTFLSSSTEESWMSFGTDETSASWSWEFNFPNSTGYYEFYSIGKKSGSTDETAPNSADASCYYNPPTNNNPSQSNPGPVNQSTLVCPTPTLNITVNDSEAVDTMNATWRSNSSGTWQTFAHNGTADNDENIIQTNSNFSTPGEQFWWSINLTDGEDGWTNATYTFTISENITTTTT